MKVSNTNRQSGSRNVFALFAIAWAAYPAFFCGSFEEWRVMPTLLITSFLALFSVVVSFEGVRS